MPINPELVTIVLTPDLPVATVINPTDLLPIYQDGLKQVEAQALIDLLPEGPAGPTGETGNQGPAGPPGTPNGAAVVNFGRMDAPFGVRFNPYEEDGTLHNPQLFCRMSNSFYEFGITDVYLCTEIVELTRPDDSPLGIETVADGGGQKLNIYRTLTSPLLGSVSALEPFQAGVFPIKADGTDKTIGYVVLHGLDVGNLISVTSFSVDLESFVVPLVSLGDPDGDISTGKGLAWEFVLENFVSGTSLGAIGYLLKLGGENLKGAGSDPSILTVASTSGAKRFRTRIRVTYLGLTEEGGPVFMHNFRTDVIAESWGGIPFATLPEPVTLECQIDHDDMPQFAYFDFQMVGAPDSSATLEFSQLSVSAIKTPNILG
jgi:hypothetical protein